MTSELSGYLTFPHAHQAFRIERKRAQVRKGKVVKEEQEVVYGLTSALPEKASPARLLALARGHWVIENGGHWVRDMDFDEDRSRARGKRAWALAAFRNLAIGLLRLAGATSIASGLRLCSRRQERAFRLIGLKIK